MDQSPQHGPSSQIPQRRTERTSLPPPKDSMREVGLVAAILLGLVLVIGGIWMYQEQAERPATATSATGNKINWGARTGIASKRVSQSPSTRAVPASADRPSPAPSSGEFDVYFDVGQDALTPKAKSLLAQQAPRIASHKEVGVLLHGHTDVRGNAAFNEALGRKRARSVEAELVKLGVPKTAIQVFSQGEQGTRCRSKTKACYRRNRRVHVTWGTMSELTSVSADAQPASTPARADKPAVATDRSETHPAQQAPVRAAQATSK